MVYKSSAIQKLKVVDAMQAVKMANARGEVKYPIKGINILKAHGKNARDSFLINDYALNTGHAAQGIPLKLVPILREIVDSYVGSGVSQTLSQGNPVGG